MKKLAIFALGVALAATAAAQSPASRGLSAAPTDADYRINVVEPQPNATIVGKDIQIVVRGPRNPQGDRAPQNATDGRDRQMNTPVFQVFIDGKSYGNLQDNQNVFVAHDVAYGPHKIVVVAKNVAGEVIDRAEIPVTSVESAATASTTTSSTMSENAAPPPSSSAPSAGTTYGSTASTGTTASTPPPPPPDTSDSSMKTLPQTASRAPMAAAAGLLLALGGLRLRRA
jgi:hypothetical protein